MLAALGLLSLLAVGCQAPGPLPTYAWPGVREALAVIEARNRRIESLSSPVDLTVRRPDGPAVTLEGALVYRRPDSLRLQAWRFHREVMDLTFVDGEAWLWTAERNSGSAPPPVGATHGPAGWRPTIFMAPPPETSRVERRGSDTEPLVVRWPLAGDSSRTAPGVDGPTARAEIDRSTLTIRTLAFFDAAGECVQTVTLGSYVVVDGLVLPTRIVGRGQWNVELRLRDVEVNTDLDPAVFEPPSRARRLE